MRGRLLLVECVAIVASVGGLFGVAAAESAPRLMPDAAVADYCAAWNAPDREIRDRLLARVWAADGVFSDPTPTLAAGRAALSGTIAKFQRDYPGARFRCSAPQMHHRVMRVTWSLRNPDGALVTNGTDFYDMAKDGHIQRVVTFFDETTAITP